MVCQHPASFTSQVAFLIGFISVAVLFSTRPIRSSNSELVQNGKIRGRTDLDKSDGGGKPEADGTFSGFCETWGTSRPSPGF